MTRLNYKLPPMTMLVAFESAARLTSFKRAASELGVTPGAVSHQIKALEKEIGSTLQHIRSQTLNKPVIVGSTTAVSSLWITPALWCRSLWTNFPAKAFYCDSG